MTRSLKKGPFVDHHLMAKVEKAIAIKDKKPVKKKVKKVKEKKVHIPHKPTIGELIQMPTKTEVKTENVPHTQTAATV